MEIGKKISLLRKNKNMTQKELANVLNVTDKAVSRWESGIGNPDVTILPQIAKIFEVSLDYLLSDEEGLPQPKEEKVETTEPQTTVDEKPVKKSRRKVFILIGIVIAAVAIIVGSIFGISAIVKDNQNKDTYTRGVKLMESAQYKEAKEVFDALSYSDSKNKSFICQGLLILEESKNLQNNSGLISGIELITTADCPINVHYEGNGKAIIEEQMRCDIVLTKEEHSLLIPSSSELDYWQNQSFYYYKNTTYLYLSAVWK